MPISDLRDRFFYPHHTHMKDTYILGLHYGVSPFYGTLGIYGLWITDNTYTTNCIIQFVSFNYFFFLVSSYDGIETATYIISKLHQSQPISMTLINKIIFNQEISY